MCTHAASLAARIRSEYRTSRESVGWSQIAAAAQIGERECACGDEKVVMFSDEGRTWMAKIVSVTARDGLGTRDVVVESETVTYSEEAEASLRYAGIARVSPPKIFTGSAAICIQACADRSGLF